MVINVLVLKPAWLHPSMRVLGLLTLTMLLPWLSIYALLTVTAVLGLLLVGSGSLAMQQAAGMLLRLKWFWFALLVLYGWFHMPDAGAWWQPSVAGLWLGVQRGAVLASLVIAVVLLQMSTPREDLLAGMLWLAWPLQQLGAPIQRMALRLVLTMEYAVVERPKLSASDSGGASSEAEAMPWWRRLGQQTVTHVQAVETEIQTYVDGDPSQVIVIPVLSWPLWHNWLLWLAVLLLLAMFGLR